MAYSPSINAITLPPMLTQRCQACNIVKRVDEFTKRHDTKSGYNYRCKACMAEFYRKRRASKPASLKLYDYAKWRSAKRKLDFNIDPEDIVVPDICPILGIPMRTPSLDRINPGKGYVKGNVRVISHRANMLRHNATYEELRAVLADAEKLKDRLDQERAEMAAHA